MKLRVLVVDDYPGAAEVSCVLLRILGHDGCAAVSGMDALEKATQHDPDVVIPDIGLPDINGYEVARRLRTRKGKRVYIAAMTGWGASEDRVQALAAGIDMHFIKPAGEDKLRAIIEAARKRIGSAGVTDRA